MSRRNFGSINGYGIKLDVVTPDNVLHLVKNNFNPEIIKRLKHYEEPEDPYELQNYKSHEGHLTGFLAIIHDYLVNTGTPFRIECDSESGNEYIFYEPPFFADDEKKHYTKKEIDDMLKNVASKLDIPCNPDYVNIRWETD